MSQEANGQPLTNSILAARLFELGCRVGASAGAVQLHIGNMGAAAGTNDVERMKAAAARCVAAVTSLAQVMSQVGQAAIQNAPKPHAGLVVPGGIEAAGGG